MPSLYTAIEITAPRQQVWQALIRKEVWKYWNTFLYDCDSRTPFAEGKAVFLALRRVPGEATTEFQAIVTLLQPGVCLQWRTAIPGFVSQQSFELQAIGSDRTQYIHQERFSGVLTRAVLPFIRHDEHKGIQRMARELKQYVEDDRR